MKISQGQNRREHLSLPGLCILDLGISRSVSIAPEIARIVFIPASHNGKSSIWKRIGPDSSPKWPKPPWRIIVIYILISFFSFSIEIVRHFHLSLSNNFYCDILHLYNIVIPIINSAEEGWYGQPKYCCKKAIHVVLLRFAVVSGLLVFFFLSQKVVKKEEKKKASAAFSV